MDFPPFPGFRPQAFEFLRELALNNTRDWFKPRKEIFADEVVWPFQCLIADATRCCAQEGLPFTGDPKTALFRIHRDTRFSKNKDPYKTWTGGVLSRDGTREGHGAIYIHLEPGKSMLASGFWMPPTEFVRAWRLKMAANPDEFLEVIEDLDRHKLKLESDEYLKRIPLGFEQHAETPIAPYLKYKSYWVGRYFEDEALQDPSFTDAVIRHARETMPLLEYGWSLIGTRGGL